MTLVRPSSVFAFARTIHALAGIVLCLFVAVFSLSGSLLVFKGDYLCWTLAEACERSAQSAQGLAKVTKAAEAHFPLGERRALVFASPQMGLHKLYLAGEAAAYLDANGQIVDVWTQNGRLEDWLFDLHHRLLLGKTGSVVSGVIGFASAALVLAGLVAFWPARRGLWRGLRLDQLNRVQLLSLHRNLGLLTALPAAFILLTGAFLSFPVTTRAVFERFDTAVPAQPISSAPGQIDWPPVLQAAAARFPGAELRMVVWPDQTGPVIIRLRQQAEWHPNGRTVVNVDPSTGGIVWVEDAQTAGTGRRAFNAIYPLHAGFVGGRLYDLLIGLTGLALATLSGLGAWAFGRKLFPIAPGLRARGQ